MVAKGLLLVNLQDNSPSFCNFERETRVHRNTSAGGNKTEPSARESRTSFLGRSDPSNPLHPKCPKQHSRQPSSFLNTDQRPVPSHSLQKEEGIPRHLMPSEMSMSIRVAVAHGARQKGASLHELDGKISNGPTRQVRIISPSSSHSKISDKE